MSSLSLLDLAHRWGEAVLVEGGRYFLVAGAVTFLVHLGGRKIAARKIQTACGLSRRVKQEIGNSIRTILIFALTATLVYLLSKVGVAHVSTKSPSIAALLVEFIGLMLFHDTWFYWAHRLLHRKRFFRLVHLTHHSSVQPTAWAAYSFSPVEAATESAFLPIYLLVFPAHFLTLVFFAIHQLVRNVMGHCGFEFMPSGFTKHPMTRAFTTTTHHDLHHREGRYNFGLYFTWWDRAMGTEHPRYHEKFERSAARQRHRHGGATDEDMGEH